MFTTKLSRATPRATAALSQTTTSSTTSAACAAAQQATRCLATRPAHQRRQSSSKASPPPDSTASGKPAPATKSKTDAAPVPAKDHGAIAPRKKTSSRRAGGSVPGKRGGEGDQFADLPSVPSLHRLDEKIPPEVMTNLSLASFFSLHRPISLTTPVPPIVNEQTFSSIFSDRSQQDPWQNGNSAEGRPEDIIITLNNTIEMLEGPQNQAENEGVRWEVLNESTSNAEGGVKHLDGAPQPRMKSLNELVASFRPFTAPPPPEPFDAKFLRPNIRSKASSRTAASSKQVRKPKQKIYVTEIRVTESTHSDGRKTYAASSTPIRRLEEQQQRQQQQPMSARGGRAERAVRDQLAQIRKPIWVRQITGMGRQRTERWVLISVKRQRKLKMKKHKHKKLMKRTRNLRRRLGRT